ncbi:uncharacterized protein J4E84_002036 [Alternaria hordeiaustralica]|uniref:uncharacterized protein n=1 Tax=Alternaria hordeiaustralica TaxID=1187925 RepID=UPI0020C341F5|nr:uncharacterized protein J4E84_002036 [Alternaria hordeiaustralica]KAI4695410.1 hypothetical protein J4E84_002036 [Alternaria hordeiaustralica]
MKERLSNKQNQATNDTSSKTLISSQSELDTLLKTHYGDASSNMLTTTSSSPQRNDSVVDLSTATDKTPSNPLTDDYLTPLSSHFVDGELVCTGGLAIEHPEYPDSSSASDSSGSSDSSDYAKWLKRVGTEEVYGGDGRSFTVKLGARRWRRKNQMKKAVSRLRKRLLFFGTIEPIYEGPGKETTEEVHTLERLYELLKKYYAFLAKALSEKRRCDEWLVPKPYDAAAWAATNGDEPCVLPSIRVRFPEFFDD